MIKIIDTDAYFAKFAPEYIKTHMKGLSPKQIEERIDELYKAFGEEKLEEFGGKSIKDYYMSFNADELVNALKEHLKKDVEPSSYLCEAIAAKQGGEEELVKMLSDGDDEAVLYAMNLLNDKNYTGALNTYLNFILSDYTEAVTELATEILSKNADKVSAAVLEALPEAPEDKKANLAEILSFAENADKIYEALVAEFLSHPCEIPFYSNLLSRYGDDRAIEVLTEKIESPKINYGDFQELRCAIEALGGEYNKKRDFTSDKVYQAVQKEKEERAKRFE